MKQSSSTSIFQPPPPSTHMTKVATPTSTKSIRPRYNRNIVSSEDGGGSSARKRARHSYIRENDDADTLATPLHEWSEVSPVTTSTTYFASALPSPAPFVNTKYEIRGGLDTPTAETERQYEALESEEDDAVDYLRPNRYASSLLHLQKGEVPVTPRAGAFDTTRGRKRKMDSNRVGWTKTIATAVGGMAWKGIEFCWTTAFGGFQAGGGTGYQMPMGTPMVIEGNALDRANMREDIFDERYKTRPTRLIRERTPIPGEFPEDDAYEDNHSNGRRDIGLHKQALDNKENDGFAGGEWTFVEKNGPSRDRGAAQTKRLANNTPTLRRPASTASIAGARQKSPSHRQQPLTSQASSPSLRSASLASPRNRSLLHRSSNPDLARSRMSPSPSKARPSLSTASPRQSMARRSSQGSTHWANSPDVQKFERQIRRKEKRDDENMNRLNKQLKDMIREGREALGTKIDVESDDEEEEDEGYAEGDSR